VVEALLEYNRRCETGGHEPPRVRDTEPLTRPPFYVIEVIPAITHSFGGLLIDREGRVLDEQGKPSAGLLVAGADAGGVYVRACAGGLANALQAARTALQSAHAPAWRRRPVRGAAA
jgi:predicted oxidoreductase